MTLTFDMNEMVELLGEGAFMFVVGLIMGFFFLAIIWAWNTYSDSWRHHPIWEDWFP